MRRDRNSAHSLQSRMVNINKGARLKHGEGLNNRLRTWHGTAIQFFTAQVKRLIFRASPLECNILNLLTL